SRISSHNRNFNSFLKTTQLAMSSTSLSLKLPYCSSLRYNSMVHDSSHGVQIEAFIYSRLKGLEICQRALLAPPARSTIISLRALRSASFETSQDNQSKVTLYTPTFLYLDRKSTRLNSS